MIPSSIDELTRVKQIGKGASCVVDVATAGASRFALKVIEKKKIVGQKQLERLFREKDLLASLKHPSIVSFHAALKDDEHLYFLLELLGGGDLFWHMKRDKRRRIMPMDAKIVLGALLLQIPLTLLLAKVGLNARRERTLATKMQDGKGAEGTLPILNLRI